MRRTALVLALLMAAAPLPAAVPKGPVDTVERIAIVSAFPPEWITLQAMIADKKEWTVNGVQFVGGTMSGKPVLLFLSGVSMTNAAMTTQLALDRFNISRIVFSGVAGGIDPALDVGDVVVPDKWGTYLESIFARDTGGGKFEPDGSLLETPRLKNYGMIYPRGVSVRRDGADGIERRFWFDVDPAMLATARTVAARTKLERCQQSLCLVAQPKVVVGGTGVSASVFMDNKVFREYLFDAFKATVTDMETAAVGQVAYANRVPYIAFRSLSDLAGGQPGENQARAFYKLASDNSAVVVKAFVAALDAK
ncbi:5'-methylthioadenosine/S-adenosylhomocysteine nucleosidase [Sphingomonas naphthae]|uniref:5'-methylthioadenosine/S-adenosylhomocysteine nucleosidase n=1 Tax=Sphingomonas naphthae TaxID=1813468 RepID=A0ABY7TRB0_9SPHN|nr:5'-methylthioadenosine/S-adenosylhomocysteine nucleosidase [Sphingomonas naphthae]WCT74729.1 5'-methylthioadenosine/S-adenosylhomocysteine nucleosidase [Sphingomonas naphthae]